MIRTTGTLSRSVLTTRTSSMMETNSICLRVRPSLMTPRPANTSALRTPMWSASMHKVKPILRLVRLSFADNILVSHVPMLPPAGAKGAGSKKHGGRSRALSSGSTRGGQPYSRGTYTNRGSRRGNKLAAGCATKKKSARGRKSNDSSTAGSFSRSKKGSGPARGGRGGIGMMPT